MCKLNERPSMALTAHRNSHSLHLSTLYLRAQFHAPAVSHPKAFHRFFHYSLYLTNDPSPHMRLSMRPHFQVFILLHSRPILPSFLLSDVCHFPTAPPVISNPFLWDLFWPSLYFQSLSSNSVSEVMCLLYPLALLLFYVTH